MLTTFASCISSVVFGCTDFETSLEASENGMEHTEKIPEKIQAIIERHKWERQHLVEFTRERLHMYCARVIYFSCTTNSIPLPETENQVHRLLIDQEAEQIIKVIFEEIIRCTKGLFAADVLSLDLPPTGPDNESLDLKLSSPLFCQRPDSSLDERTKTMKLYESIVYRDNTNPLYQLENYHHKTSVNLKARGISSWPPVADVVYKVIKEKVSEILNEVRKQPLQEAA